MFNALKSLFIHDVCYCCDQWLTSQEASICMTCLSQLPFTEFHLTPDNNELYDRIKTRVEITGAMSLYFFDKKGKLQQLIQHIKYHNAPHIGYHLGQLYGSILKQCTWTSRLDAIIPVPLHWKKKIIRGYNQSDAIGEGLSHVLGIPVLREYLVRKHFTQTQTKLSGPERWTNVQTAFDINTSTIAPTSILLLDDVITTGSTLSACINTIYSHYTQPPEIFIASIAMARHS